LDLFQAFVLGLAQGAAEFLPISSSAHLVLIPEIMGWDPPELAFDVLLHAGTLLAVLVYFWRDLADMALGFFSRDPQRAADRRLAWLVIAGTVPTVVIAIAGMDFFESLFDRVIWVGCFLILTSIVLTLSERFGKRTLHDSTHLTWGKAVLIGIAQGTAIAPGISRSGATIAAGLSIGLDRERAARFSFLLSVPIISAAAAKSFMDVINGSSAMPGFFPSMIGFVTAALVGYLAIAGLLAYLRTRPLYVFAAYTGLVGISVVIWQLFV